MVETSILLNTMDMLMRVVSHNHLKYSNTAKIIVLLISLSLR